eukprot:c56103_g1_i1 orf=2-181(-)
MDQSYIYTLSHQHQWRVACLAKTFRSYASPRSAAKMSGYNLKSFVKRIKEYSHLMDRSLH